MKFLHGLEPIVKTSFRFLTQEKKKSNSIIGIQCVKIVQKRLELGKVVSSSLHSVTNF